MRTLRASTIGMLSGIALIFMVLAIMQMPTLTKTADVKILEGKVEGSKLCAVVTAGNWVKVGKVQFMKETIVKVVPPQGMLIKVKLGNKVIVGDYFVAPKGTYDIYVYSQFSGEICLIFEPLR